MSKYVRRCTGAYCHTKVKGNSSFRKLKGGGFSDVCKFCEEQAFAEGLGPSRNRRRPTLAALQERERAMTGRLERLRQQIARMEQERQSA